ncbi:MAG: iron-sulfur cluster repair di-iron protein, ric [Oscillospiraceae bacterium]|jgi:iron-sulfur cluster repair protein YtfE (RIC family)
MTNKQNFYKVKEKHFPLLGQYVPVVARVHGKSHPEFYDVHKLFDALAKKIEEAGPEVPDLKGEFEKLREVTNHYTVPEDVCESYQAVYNMLAELDQAYQE